MDKKFAVFDIDGTVIRWQLFHAVVDELAKQGSIDAQSTKVIHDARMTWKKRAHSDSFKDYEHAVVDVYHAALKNIRMTDFDAAIAAIFETYRDQVYTYTRDLIKSLKAQNYTLIAISGSHQEIVEKMAEHYGFDYVIGSKYPTKDGAYTGEEITPVIVGKGKLLKELVAVHGLSWKDSIAVGDTGSDISMLKLVEQPIAFNPNQELFNEASTEGWKIVVERKNVIYELEKHGLSYVLA